MINNRRLLTVAQQFIPPLFYILLLLFLYLYLRGLDVSRLYGLKISWGYIFIASIFGLAFRFLGAFIWLTILKSLGAKDIKNKIQLLHIYAKSWLGRYIPGTAPWILGKIYFASRQGISKNKLAVSSLLEGALQVSVILFLAFFMLIFDTRLDVINIKLKLLMILVLIGCGFVLVPTVFNTIMKKVYFFIKRKVLASEHLATNKTIIHGALLYAVGALISGLAFFFITKAFYPVNYHNLLFIMGASNLAGAASMLAIFVPSGLGVREGIQLTLLSLIMPKEFALIVTISTRLWGIFMDFLFFGISKLLNYYKSDI